MTEERINASLAREDIYEAVNGEWMKEAEIPADLPMTGGFYDIALDVEKLLMNDLEKMAEGEIPLTCPEQAEMVSYYRLARDTEARDERGIEPLLPYIRQVLSMERLADFESLCPKWQLLDLPLPFYFSVHPRYDDALNEALWIVPRRPILPDTTSYDDEETSEQLLGVYREMLLDLMAEVPELAPKAMAYADGCLAFDRKLVPHLLSNEVLAEDTKHYHPTSREDFAAYSKNLDLVKLADTLVSGHIKDIIVTQPNFMKAIDEVFTEANLFELKAWLLGRLLVSQAPYLSEVFRQKASRYELALSGSPEPMRQDRFIFHISKMPFDQVLGDYYGKKYFGEEANRDIQEMVNEIIAVFKERLENNTWLSKETIKKAQKKLDTMRTFVGYPETFPAEYSKRTLDPMLPFYENTLRLNEIINREDFQRFDQKVDRTRWEMPADMVNAYFNPSGNLICFPAGILQAPFYSVKQSRAKNLGGIGAVMAHEITHAFDNNGAKFDEIGNLKDWWLKEDYDTFEGLTKRMIELWDGEPFADGKVNGALTVSENIADEGGLAGALSALKKADNPDYKAFFYNFARIWRQKGRKEFENYLLKVDVHSPSRLRAKITPKNLDEFHETFGTKPGDGMWLAPEDRVQIW